MLQGVTNATLGSVFPYPSTDTYSMVDYAHFNKDCVEQTLTLFLQFVPFILLLQVILTFKFTTPRTPAQW
jgi:hypothetical protein